MRPAAGAAGWAVPREGLLAFLKIRSPYRRGGLESVLEWLENTEVGVPADRQGARCSHLLELERFQTLYPP